MSRDPLLRAALTRAVRQPVVGVTLAAAAAVLALATCAAPLYRAAVGNAALEQAVDGFDATSLGLVVGTFGTLNTELFSNAGDDPYAMVDGVLQQAVDEAMGAEATAALPEPVVTVYGDLSVGRDVDDATPAQLYAHTGIEDFLPERQACPSGGDVWVSTRLAEQRGVGPCDTLPLLEMPRGEARVAGVYRDLLDVIDTSFWNAPDPLPPDSTVADFWSGRSGFVVRLGPMGPEPEPPLVMAEPETVVALAQERGLAPTVHFEWTYPVPTETMSLARAEQAAEGFTVVRNRVRDFRSDVGAALGWLTSNPVGQYAFTPLPDIVAGAGETVAAVAASMDPIGTAGQVGALLVVAVAGVFEARRRRSERLLAATQGSGPVASAVRAALESLLPVALGTAAGAALAVALVTALAPGRPPGADTVASVLPPAAGWALAALVLLALGAAVQARSAELVAPARLTGRLRRYPWEVVPLALAAASYWTIATREEVLLATASSEGGPSLDASYVLFPLLLLVGSTGLAARLLPRAGALVRRLSRRAPGGAYLALHRLAGASATAALLVAGAALGVGVLTYSAGVAGSSERTATSSARLIAGAPVTVALPPRAEVPEDTAFPATVVARDTARLLPADREVDLLTVDTATFAGTAFWEDGFADASLGDLLDAIDRPAGDALPVLLVGASPGERPALETTRYRIPVEVVARPRGFPGMSGEKPLLVASFARLVEHVNASGQSTIDEALMLSRTSELWASTDSESFSHLVTDVGESPQHVRAFEDVANQPRLAALRWSLGYLQAVGAAAGLLGLLAVALYLHGRQRSREVAFLLARRMGLSRRQHRRAVLLELAGLLCAAVLVGAVPALAAARLVVGAVDTLPGVGPPPQFVTPWAIGGAIVPVLLAVSALAAVVAQRALDRARPGEVMRGID